jgi:hypothetical protein
MPRRAGGRRTAGRLAARRGAPRGRERHKSPVPAHQLSRPPRLPHRPPRAKLSHVGLDVEHRRAVDRVQRSYGEHGLLMCSRPGSMSASVCGRRSAANFAISCPAAGPPDRLGPRLCESNAIAVAAIAIAIRTLRAVANAPNVGRGPRRSRAGPRQQGGWPRVQSLAERPCLPARAMHQPAAAQHRRPARHTASAYTAGAIITIIWPPSSLLLPSARAVQISPTTQLPATHARWS